MAIKQKFFSKIRMKVDFVQIFCECSAFPHEEKICRSCNKTVATAVKFNFKQQGYLIPCCQKCFSEEKIGGVIKKLCDIPDIIVIIADEDVLVIINLN